MSDFEKKDKASTPPLDEEYEKGNMEGTTTHQVRPAEGLYDPSKESVWTRLGVTFESFKRAPGTTGGLVIEGAAAADKSELLVYENPMLQQKMKPRHLQMIAVGGSIGTGLFIGSGGALAVGGPAALLLDWIIIGFMVLMTCQAIGEMAILYPLSGGFYALAVRMLDPAWGFAMGWNYVLQWAVVLPLEITAAGITVGYWENNVPLGAWITIFLLAIILINVFGTLGYAEEEFWSSCLKLFVVVLFIFIAVVCNAGGGPKDGEYGTYVGGRYWRDPGAFANGFPGVCAVFVTAAFSFAGTELVGLAASETPNPRKTMPSAIKNTFWRITIIYILSLLMIGLLLPYNDEFLLFGGGTAAASPFVRVLDKAKIGGINHLINVTICISVLSIGLSCVYGGSRTLAALAETGYAPKIFAYVDKSGRPLWAVVFVLAFGPLAYVNLAQNSSTVFAWLLALSGLSTLFTWGSIMLCHIRFRKAWKVQGHSVEELPFRAMFGVWGSWIGLILVFLVLLAQGYIAIWPVGGQSSDPNVVATNFFQVYLALPVVIACYIIGYVWKRTTPQRAHEIDLDTGRKSWYTVEQMREYRAELAAQPWYKKAYRILFSG
jgi:amino acid transporter